MPELDILAIFSHPDDAELCIGGTLFKLNSIGYSVGILDATKGEMGTRGTPEMRAGEAANAANILGIDLRENLALPDGNVTDDLASRIKLVKALRRLKPKLIFTHQIGDPHPDHDALARLVRSGARLASMMNFDPESGEEKIAVPRIAHNVFSRRSDISFVVDISNELEKKMEAIRAYRSQFYDPSSSEPETRLTSSTFLKEIEDRCKYFGSLIGVAAGEPFYIREALNVADPYALLSRSNNLYS